MSFTLEMIINPIVLLIAGVIGIIIGYAVSRIRLAKAQSKIERLESDLLNSNRETLEAQKAYVILEERLKDQAIPVIPMKINGKDSSKEKATK